MTTKILAFNFTKISAERESKIDNVKNINVNIKFKDIGKEKLDFMKESDALKISFEFTIEYEPKKAFITFEGIIIMGATPELLKKTLEDWKNNKINEEMKKPIYSLIFNKCTLKALNLEEQLNLPTHIKIPQLKFDK